MRVTILGIAAVALASLALGGTPASPAHGQEPPVYGRELMTEQERLEYQERMRTATSEEEREQIRSEHHARMQERADEMGVTLPDGPPMGAWARVWDEVRAWARARAA